MNKAKEKWEQSWEQETHTTDYAKKRIKSAKSAKLTPVRIDTKDMFGYFQGSSGRYETFLDYCPCGDFRRSKLPCKHIYRLAIELGVIDESKEDNVNSIPTPKNEKISLDDTINIVEALSEKAQLLLLNIASNVRSTNPDTRVKQNSHMFFNELLQSGLVIDAGIEIIYGKKEEIISFLKELGVTFNTKSKKTELVEICNEHFFEESKERFGYYQLASIPTKFSPTKIHYYLHRKYDNVSFYDEYLNEIENIPLLQTNLPDDDVTMQLRKRGYY